MSDQTTPVGSSVRVSPLDPEPMGPTVAPGADRRIFLPSIGNTSAPASPAGPSSMSGWLTYLNYYRSQANLPSVTENATWNRGCVQHARYMVKNDLLSHDEDTGNSWFTEEGREAARASNVAGSYDAAASDYYAIDSWMQAPFHAVCFLDPSLRQVGYGSYREADGGVQMAAALNVLSGQGAIPPDIQYPIKWPDAEMTTPVRLHWGENPSPLTSCPGYSSPSGTPIILQMGPGDRVPYVMASSFWRDGVPLEHCVFDESTYFNPDPGLQDLGRTVLDRRDAIVLIPREPLAAGARYEVSIMVDGHVYEWAFNVSNGVQIAGFDDALYRGAANDAYADGLLDIPTFE